MPRTLNPLFLFRIFAIGVIFAIVSLVVFPVFIIRAGDNRNNRVFTGTINFFLLRVLGIKLVVDRSEAVYDQEPVVVIANHQGAMDVISFGAILPKRSATLAKKSLAAIPVWGQILRLGGNILVDRSKSSNRFKAMRKLNEMLAIAKVSLVIFPEGTRNKNNTLRSFHDGAFRCAMRNKVLVQPVVFSTYAGNIDLSRWHAGTIGIKVLAPIEIIQMDEAELGPLVEQVQQLMQAEIHKLDRGLAA